MKPTRFNAIRPVAALSILVALLATMALLLAVSAQAPEPAAGAVAGRPGDAATYRQIVAAMHDGAGYYPAAHEALLANGYPTRSVFNWRTPFYASMLALLPSLQWLAPVMFVLALGVISTVAAALLQRAGRVTALLAAMVLALALAGGLAGSLAVFSEMPAGMLVLLAIGFTALGWRWPAMTAALLALLVRELAAPALLVMAGAALLERRYRETAIWVLAGIAYLAFFLWHTMTVAALLGPADAAAPGGWLRFGGLRFMLATAQANGVFWLLPMSVTAIALPLALLGLLAWPGRIGALTAGIVIVYLAAFLLIGKPDNAYWGMVYTPLLSLGLAWAPFALADLARSSLQPVSERRKEP